MKKSMTLLKLISIICCLAIFASALFACTPSGTGDDTSDDTTLPVDTGDGTGDEVTDPVEDPKSTATLIASNQKAVNGKIFVNYKIDDELVKKYEKICINVYHDDENKNLLCSTEIDATLRMADIATSYGKLRLELVGTNADKTDVLATDKVSVWADEYNFATLNATFPVVYYTLDMFSMADGETRTAFEENEDLPVMDNVPTFVTLDRASAYDWTKLPENVYPLPNTIYEKATAGNFHPKNVLMAEYIKELYEINPSSDFHLYCVDNYCELILKLMVANGIPEDQYDAVMISDGTATVGNFKAMFAGADAETKYAEMKAEWERIKEAAANGEENYLDNVLYGSGTQYSVLQRYSFVIANEEENVEWWCSRNLFTANTESEYIKTMVENMTSVKYININDMLSILSENDQAALKELFHYDSETFSAAEEAGKKVLLIIGTSNMEENLSEYLSLLDNLYGDEYMIYYKGHPKYPTGLNEEKNALFEEKGVIDIDSSIAAELILFYCPDIYLTGWQSTTFKAAQDGKFLMIFNHTKASGSDTATSNGYGDMPDVYASAVTNEADGKTYIELEYDADDTVKYYDASTDSIIDNLPTAAE